MSINGSFIKNALYSISYASILAAALPAYAGPNEPEQTPLFVSKATPPLNMLVMGRDHKLYYEAYNDASDLDGDGVIDVGYKPSIDYYGYFDSNRCYSYSTSGGRFNPEGLATNKKCSGQWSGDYLNYLTTSRMDALRKVFYGGYRSTDTSTTTVLERSHIPQDAHSWGKEYLSEAHDGYKISDYTPLSQPTSGKRHLFANTTVRSDESWGPRLRYITNSDFRVWEWVSIERPVAGNKCRHGSTGPSCGTIVDHRVRVAVCVDGKLEDNCQTYPNGKSKPTGILHDFGEADRMYFGLLTGSYAKNTAGGTLRSNMASFSQEIDETTGRFIKNDGIVATINNLKTIELSSSGEYNVNCGWIVNGPINDGQCSMWGNPIGEMMYETMRYFAGASGPHSSYSIENNAKDSTLLSLPKPNWISPYKTTAQGGGNYPACAIPVMTVVSDINPSYDFKLPGSHWSNFSASGAPSIAGLNVSTEVDAIWASEGGGSRNIFIGESDGLADSAPTAKIVSNLSTVRGLSPEEPSKQGTYYSAGVARFGANNAIGGDQKMMTYAVALASPLPKIEFPVGNNTVTVVPFAKSVGGSVSGSTISATGNFQPTNQIVDYYVAQIANTDPLGSDRDASVNGGRAYAQFRINYEDVEQGADHDMDAIALYTLAVNAAGELDITLNSEYAAGSIVQYMGYAISGTNNDGVYLEICDLSDGNTNNGLFNNKSRCAVQVRYKLNTPPGKDPGWCTTAAGLASNECVGLPYNATRTFTPSATPGATLLNNPLWYAAKYGMPKRAPADVAGDPDNYFLVTNALTLKDQLTKAFNDIMQRNSSVTSPAIKPTTTQASDSSFFVYRTDYNVETWSGNLIKETIDTNSGDRTPHWNAASGSVAGRSIKMANGKSLANFTWSNLTEAQQNALHANPQTGLVDNAGEQRLAFIKGENDSFRKRSNRMLGDIINSSPVVVEGAQYLHYLAEAIEPGSDYASFASNVSGRKSLVFVGANDGMLHAFNTETGAEEFAFVPSAVIPSLNKLTSPGYNEAGGEHHFFVDGTPVVRDVYIDSQWRTVLIGTLRAGGRSIFALDITEPNNISLLWELNVGDDLSDAEKTAGTASDVGYSFPIPAIARLHNGNWAVVTGNGYDSPSGRAVLFLIDIADGKLTKIPTKANDSLNGLSSVRVADNNSDGIADYVYAGDLRGNLWRFDLDPTGKTGSNGYRVSFGGSPLFTAKDGTDASANAQAITAPPSLVRHPSLVGYIVMFGSGRYFQLTDKETDKVDTLYGIWDTQTRLDEVATTTPTLDRRNLQEQTFTTQTVNTWNADNPNLPAVSQNIRILSDTPITWHGPSASDGKHGWYLDLKVGSNLKGERVVDEMAARGQVLLFTTRTPSVDPCEPGLEGWTYGINPYTGGRTTFNVFDFNKSTKVSAADSYNGTVVSGYETPAGGISLSGDTLFSTDGSSITVDFGASVSGRQSWQIIPEDQ